MDCHEHTLTELSRLLLRSGVRHVFLTQHLNILSQIQGKELDGNQGDALFHGKHLAPRTLWTYAELSADLALANPPDRLLLLRKIQQSAKTHLKWEDADLGTLPLVPEPDSLKLALSQSSCTNILYFGGAAPEFQELMRTESLPKLQLIFLPSLDDMATGDQNTKNLAWQTIKAINLS